MKKTNKVLSLIMAVSMLLSMLACFTLPTTAEGEEYRHFYVASAKDWVALAGDNSVDWTSDKNIIHVQNDISFIKSAAAGTYYWGQFGTFGGTLDGHGYKFTDINTSSSAQNGASLIGRLTGTIQNLTLDSTCTFTNTNSSAKTGAFVAKATGGTIRNCASYATVTAQNGQYVSGFVGVVIAGDLTIDGCIFNGTITGSSSSGSAGAFVGYTDTEIHADIRYSVAMGGESALSAATTGMVCAASASNVTIEESYALGGMKVFKNGTDATLEAAHTMDDIKKAVWTINTQRKSIKDDGIYFSVDADGKPYPGSINDRVVQVTTVNGTTQTVEYYLPRSGTNKNEQTVITPATVSGKTPIVSGAEYIDGKIYVGHNDITVKYEDSVSTADQNKAKLQAMITAYEAMEGKGYFSDWSKVSTWLTNSKKYLANNDTSNINRMINTKEPGLSQYVSLTYPDYPSITDYPLYKYSTVIKDYAISSKEDWLAAVEMSDYAKNPDTAVNFSGVTLHLTADINMEHTPMMPLCYSWIFDGNLDGHDYVFKNINIDVENAYGPVGLIGTIGLKQARTIQNLGIESGKIKVSGWPRYKATYMSIEDTGNRVGVIAGKNHYQNTLIRKCWNGAEIRAENIGAAAGIIADPRNYAVVDSCFNVGVMQKTVYGIMGYAANKGKLFNSMGGAAGDGVLMDQARAYASDIAENIVNICGVVHTIKFDNFSSTSATKKLQKAVEETYNTDYTELNYPAAAWRVNKGYQQQSYGAGERIYLALNENGEVRFGKPDGSDQIYRIALVGGDTTQYTYASAGHKITLDIDFEANYYACEDPAVTIKGNTLVFTKDVQTTDKTFTVYVGYNADRGNVVSDDEINSTDALETLYMAAGKKTKNLLTADVDSNHYVDIRDAYQIIRYIFTDGQKACFIPGKPTGREDGYLKVLTYNTKSFHYDPYSGKSNNNGRTAMCRYAACLTELKEINADIIGFQEMDRFNKDATYNGTRVDQIEQLKADLNAVLPKEDQYVDNSFFITVPDTTYHAEGGYGHGILSKYPILESDGVHFAGKGQLYNEDLKLDDSEGRGFAWYKLDINKNGKYDIKEDLIFYNCHFMQFHEEQIRYMTNYMRENHPNDRIVCTGDMNVAAFKVKGSFVDNDYFTAINGGKYFNSFFRTNAHSGSLIDNIFISENVEYYKPSPSETGLFTQRGLYGPQDDYGLDNYPDKTWPASDHLPVWTFIKK